MVDKWSSNTSSNGESGILRKTSNQHSLIENRDDLLVFGYACKIFRNDEKAQNIDQGKHLIPWMGDQSLKIDRYDVRATLHDLAPYEPPPGGYTNRMSYLSPAEQKAEQLCEEERYYSMYHNEMEEQIYQEEEQKRVDQMKSFGQVNFNYDSQNNDTPEIGEQSKKDDSDEVFIPLQNFIIPPDIELPHTMKDHAIIEKTAKFISSQGAQMEILLKTKQANNAQFDFLINNNRLNRYYRHVLESIKQDLYPIKDNIDIDRKNEKNEDAIENQINNDLGSCTPSIISSTKMILPTIAYKPSANCAYTQLISKIKGVPIPNEKKSDNRTNENFPPFIQSLNIKSKEIKQSSTTKQAQIEKTCQVPVIPTPNDFIKNTNGVEIKNISTGLMLAQYYNSDSESENHDSNDDEDSIDFPIPEDILKNIIDKTALYVIKNGKNFENILKSKDPSRFSFLDEYNEYYYYYIYKVTGKIPKYDKELNSKIKSKVITPVSFSIKSKDDTTIPTKPGLLLNQSSGEEDNDGKTLNELQNDPSTAISHQQILCAVDSTYSSKAEEVLNNISEDLQLIAQRNSEVEKRDKDAKRIAEEKLRDRLAAAAREKLGMLSKEKQLQLERKKKAMAFLNQIKMTKPIETPTDPKKDVCQSNIIECTASTSSSNADIMNNELSSDTDSVHSIPTHTTIQCETLKQSRKRSRSRSRSKHKKKKSKTSHSKKKSKRKSRTRSPSRENRKHHKSQS